MTKDQVKQKIVTSTFMFIFATVFIMVFTSFLGEENSLIAITSFIAMLLFMGRDLTGHLVKSTITFIVINIIMGAGAYLVNYNMWIGIPINLVLVFLIGYYFYDDLNKPLFLPFMLQYIFLIADPVTSSQQPLRFLSLLVGAILIMVPQVLFNIKKLEKQSQKIFIQINILLQEKVKLLLLNQNPNDNNHEISSLFDSLKVMILERKEKDNRLSKRGQIILEMLASLEKINITLDKDGENKVQLGIIQECLAELSKILAKEISDEQFKQNIEQIKLRLDDKNYEVINNFKLISAVLVQKGDRSFDIKKKKAPFSIKGFIQDNKDSVRFSYGIRMAIGVTITCFLKQFLKLEEGEWMMFTILSLVNPIYEVGMYKAKDRIISTLGGAITVVILLSIFKSVDQRSIILLVVGYIMTYMVKYKHTIFFATICAITMATGARDVTAFAFQRIMYVIIGFCFALVLNNFILKRELSVINKDLMLRYKNIISKMTKEFKIIADNPNKEITNDVNELFLTTTLIENKIKENFAVSLEEFKEIIKEEDRQEAVEVYYHYIEYKNKKFL